jgi:hypothetical protein
LGQLSVRVDFLCIGAQKAGTTWLHEMLRKFPQCGLPENKEVHFWDWHRRKGLGWYSQQFPRGKKLVLGEITPCYMALKDRDVREIHQLFPNARIIFLYRDLVDRAWSALTMELRNEVRGLKAGEFDTPYDEMDETVRIQLQLESNPDNYADDYFMSRLRNRTHTDRSDYAAGLSRWLTHFSSEKILVLDYRDVSERPDKLLASVLKHIGLEHVSIEQHIGQDDLTRRVNTAISSNHSIRPSLLRKMQDFLRPRAVEFNKLLREHWPDCRQLDEYPVEEKGKEVCSI